MIPTSRDCGLAEWINIDKLLQLVQKMNYRFHAIFTKNPPRVRMMVLKTMVKPKSIFFITIFPAILQADVPGEKLDN